MLNAWYTKHKKTQPTDKYYDEKKKLKPVISIKKNESIDFVGHAKVLTLTLTLEFSAKKREANGAGGGELENNQQKKIKYSKKY